MTRGACKNGFVLQVPINVRRQGVGRPIAPGAVLFQAHHHDPVQFSANRFAQLVGRGPPLRGHQAKFLLRQRRQPGRRIRRFLFPDRLQDGFVACLQKLLRVERCLASQQFVEQHPQGVDVAPSVDVFAVGSSLFGTHVRRRAHELVKASENGPLGEPLRGGLGDAEINHLRHRPIVLHAYEHVGRLQVTVNDALLVRVLHRLTHLHEQFQTLVNA